MRKPIVSLLAVIGMGALLLLGHAALVATASSSGPLAANAGQSCAVCHAG